MNQPPLTDEQDTPPRRELSRRARLIGVVVWSSFLASAAGTMFFFAFVAPTDLIGEDPQGSLMDHLAVYSLGFFGLWCLSSLAAALALYMLRVTGVPPAERDERGPPPPEPRP